MSRAPFTLATRLRRRKIASCSSSSNTRYVTGCRPDYGERRLPIFAFNATFFCIQEQNAVSTHVPMTRPVTERFDGQDTEILSILIKGNVCVRACVRCPDESIALTGNRKGDSMHHEARILKFNLEIFLFNVLFVLGHFWHVYGCSIFSNDR
ncbi:hypothetical protein AVEN_225205-1 [Araneus ventricosus]|uniref:Uncharacterized protein n=1 Tax=Araneus ventricosus TaxID=182803 RepID=A0A4Y2AMK7_ARAVE|nr:hypothetical protein AVEN_225205-1 [Araneus ventricosus]